MSITIKIQETAQSKEEIIELLHSIADMIDLGYTSGSDPNWDMIDGSIKEE